MSVPKVCFLSVLAVTLLASLGFSQSADQSLSIEKSKFLASSHNLGPEDGSKNIAITVWLKQPNRQAFDALVKQIYTKGSPQYHRFLTLKEYNANFAPGAYESKAVKEYLESNNFKITSVDKNNHYIRAEGRVADAQKAFNVQINRFQVKNEIHRAPLGEPSVSGPASAFVASIKGLHDFGAIPTAVRPKDVRMPISVAGEPKGLAEASIQNRCLNGVQTIHLPTPPTVGPPTAVYTGLRYGNDATNTCPGYNPTQLQTAYGLNPLYGRGWDGTGQTIVIVDAYGSPTIQADANLYSQIYGLPPLTSSNFNIYYPGGVPTGSSANWTDETSLDVELAHAIAPGANIALVIAPDPSALDVAEFWAIENPEIITPYANGVLGYVISNSWAAFEYLDVYFGGKAGLEAQYLNTELAASLGVSANFATGDWGDNVAEIQNLYGITTPPSVVTPADSPYATAIGGTSLFLDSGNHIRFQTGWGNNETRLSYPLPNNLPYDPPLHLGFIFGAGGGQSIAWPRPAYQSGLSIPGNGRLLPDISEIADPYTGVNVIIGGSLGVIGGTSLATPVFSGIWAIANQAAGPKAPLGQAAPYLYSLPSNAIQDVLPVSSPNDVHGKIFNPPNPVLIESASDLAQPLYNTTSFLSALYYGASTRWYDLTFGTDTTLTVTPGWDDVTGLGTPNGVKFVNAVVAAAP
ncbi:MAG: S8/S53 family peptidase [Acidobacteriales bacterium]|nr:S8/S53 family peptidase [Terriglobales bacterium]